MQPQKLKKIENKKISQLWSIIFDIMLANKIFSLQQFCQLYTFTYNNKTSDFMFENYSAYQQQSNPKGKTIYLMQNGNPDFILKMTFIKPITKSEIMQLVQKNWWSNRYKNIRIYGIDAVQYFDQDLLYLKNGDRIFISKGQDFDSNRNFGQYQIIKLLGQGGFGSVSLAVNKITGQNAAIKVIKSNKIISSSCIDMIFRQAQNLKSLSHPNIVKILNCYTLKNMKFVIIMQYLQGGQLKQILKSKIKFQQQQAHIYFKQIINAVSYCHRQNIVHRDLKLQNILLTKQHIVKVTDFGISGVADRFNPQVDWGTLKYMPPQILAKKQKINAFSGDIWACGIILYYMLVGYLPFSGTSTTQITNKIINGKVEFPVQCQISNGCKQLIQRMLQKNHKQRITMNQIENNGWFMNGCQKCIQIQLLNSTSSKKLTQSDSAKPPIKSRKLFKKSTIPIPKRLQKQKNQVLQQLNGYRMTRKLFKSQSKCFPQLRSTQNRNTKYIPYNSKISFVQFETFKKPFFKAN